MEWKSPSLLPSRRGPQVILPRRLLKMPQVSAETTPFNSTVTDILVNLILISSSLPIIYPSSLTFLNLRPHAMQYSMKNLDTALEP